MQGKNYTDLLKVIDLTLDIPPQQLINNDAVTGGYGIVSRDCAAYGCLGMSAAI